MKALLALTMLFLAFVCQAQTTDKPDPVVGSKNFTESVILGEIAAGLARKAGIEVSHRRQLGGTRILWRALENGQIDVYPEYTGTLAQELLQMPGADEDALRTALDKRGLAMTGPLGFNNTYALGMRGQREERCADTKHYRLGNSSEFHGSPFGG